MNSNSDFLFAQPSFLSGMASVLDLGGTLLEFNESLTPEQADHAAMMLDWRAIGEDMRRAMQQFAAESGIETKHLDAVAR